LAAGLAANLLAGLAGLLQRLAPQRVDIGMLTSDLHGSRRRATEIDRQLLLLWLDRREGLLRTIELALMVERLGAAPHLLDHPQEFIGARITLVMFEPVAVLALLGGATATDHVQGQAAIEQVGEAGQLAGRQG